MSGKLGRNQAMVLGYLNSVPCNIWTTPTEIGLCCGQGCVWASSWACAVLKGLVKRGLVEKHPTRKGRYRLAQAVE